MSTEVSPDRSARARTAEGGPLLAVLVALSVSHLLNDVIQSLIPAIYPILKASYRLSFTQIGLITLTFQLTASLLQPLVGMATDRQPRPSSLAIGMGFTLAGLLLLSRADRYPIILAAAALVGVGSSIFHPESSRMARAASGGRHGLAQSLFQVGGNFGSALGPLLAAYLIVPGGQGRIAWFSIAAVAALIVLVRVGRWYRDHLAELKARPRAGAAVARVSRSPGQVGAIIVILLILMFSKHFYTASLSSYYTFYLIDKFQISIQSAQLYLFVFLGSVAAGTIAGGPIGDRLGFKFVIWGSILGVLPFTLILPHANLFWTGVLSVPIGLILASASPAVLVYAQELVPGRVGTVAGLFLGFAFGIAGLGAALLGRLADATSIGYVYQICAYLPAIGLLTALLPDLNAKAARPGGSEPS